MRTFEEELKERELVNYPPFCHIVGIVSSDKARSKAKNQLDNVVDDLKNNNIDFIGPGPCFLSKINDQYRYHIIIKIKILPSETITRIFKNNSHLMWDVDPTELL